MYRFLIKSNLSTERTLFFIISQPTSTHSISLADITCRSIISVALFVGTLFVKLLSPFQFFFWSNTFSFRVFIGSHQISLCGRKPNCNLNPEKPKIALHVIEAGQANSWKRASLFNVIPNLKRKAWNATSISGQQILEWRLGDQWSHTLLWSERSRTVYIMLCDVFQLVSISIWGYFY